MFFKKKKEIEKLKREIDSLTTANNALTKSNKELKEELNGDHVDSAFCAVCENGIPLKDCWGNLYKVKCAFKCECENFERKPQ